MCCRVRSCCCGCFSHQTGVQILGIVHAALGLTLLVGSSVVMLSWNVDDQNINFALGLGIAFGLADMIAHILLAIGSAKRKSYLMVPAMVVILLEIIAYMIGVFLWLVTTILIYPLIFHGIIGMIVTFGATALETYWFIVIKSLYSEFKSFSSKEYVSDVKIPSMA